MSKRSDNIKINKYGIRRTACVITAGVLCAAVLSGCGNLVDMPELTEEQEELVTEYAAGLILKYDPAYAGSGLLTEEELQKSEAEEKAIRAREREAKAAAEEYLAKKANAQKEKAESEKSDDNEKKPASEPTDQAVGDLADFYGMDAFDISFTGYELSESYPTSGADMLMAMDATAGNQLCVVKFDVTNSSGADAKFDMFYRSPNFYLTVNDGEKVHQQYTLLLDDMAASNDDFAAGQTQERVLIFEIPDSVGDISSMTMQAKNAEGVKGTMILK